ILLSFANLTVHAEGKNVTDCLEGENCEELQQSTEIELNNTNDMLVESENKSSSSFFFNFLKMIFALLLVLALIYFILTFMKKRNKLRANSDLLGNLGGISLGTNKSVQLIKVGDKVYLIGVGENVELMKEITDESLIETLLTETEDQEPVTSYIQSIFKGKSKQTTKTGNFTNTFKQELNKLKKERNNLIDDKKVKDDNDE
ncbi:MAG TPA: flagellar biosynthetic protein FliO, partial [Pseudogracilibacillus sp.]|nr:flagellar biosynthetic protein FliO [Pseudogracilibacillus sp.]